MIRRSARLYFARAALAAAGLSLALVASCMPKAKADRGRVFVLMPVASPGPRVSSQATVGIGPIEVADYLDERQLVTRVAPNEIHLEEDHLWGEPLRDAFAQVLRGDLERQLGTRRVVMHPFEGVEPDVLVAVEVLRFEQIAGGPARVSARWTIRNPQGGEPSIHELTVDVTPGSTDPQARAAALSQGVARLSEAMAVDLRRELGQVAASPRAPARQ